MAATDKPDLSRVWAEGAPGPNIIDPDVGEPGKFDDGWVDEIPPFEYFNFLQQLFTQALKHASEQGAMIWDDKTNYPENGWAKGSNGILYRSLIADNLNNDPVSDDINNPKWETLLTTYSDMKTDRKNFVVNGSFAVHQRTAVIAIPSGTDYLAPDRFIIEGTSVVGGSGQYTRKTAGDEVGIDGTVFYARQEWTGATGISKFINNVEGIFYAENKSMTLTFMVRSSIATQIKSSVQVFFTDISFLAAETKTVNIDADTWTKVTQVVTYGDFTGADFNSLENKIQLQVQHLGTGTYNFDLAEVQFEFGSVPTEFEYRSTSEEEFLCIRYYNIINNIYIYPPATNGKYSAASLNLANPMRGTPIAIFAHTDEGTVSTSDLTLIGSSRRNVTIAAKFDNIGGSTKTDRLRINKMSMDTELY